MKRRDEVLVGLLLIVAVAVGVLGTIWLVRGGFSSGYSLYARFPWGAGLKVGQPVELAGVNVGYVADVQLDPNGTLITQMAIEEEYGIPVGTTAQVIPVGIFGDQAIALTPTVPSRQYIAHGDTVPTGANAPTTAALLSRADTIERSVAAITTELQRQLVAEGGLADLRGTLADLRQTLAATNRLVAQVSGIAAEQSAGLTSTLATARRSIGALDSVVLDSTLRNLKQTTANAQQLTANLQQTSQQMNAILAQLQSGQGTAGKLLNDPALYNNLQGLVARLDSIAADLQRNPKKYVNLSIF